MYFIAPPGRFSPECPAGAMSNFLHVTLTSEAMYEGLVGPRALGLRCSYSVSGYRPGYIERFCSNHSRRNSDFSSAVDLPT